MAKVSLRFLFCVYVQVCMWLRSFNLHGAQIIFCGDWSWNHWYPLFSIVGFKARVDAPQPVFWSSFRPVIRRAISDSNSLSCSCFHLPPGDNSTGLNITMCPHPIWNSHFGNICNMCNDHEWCIVSLPHMCNYTTDISVVQNVQRITFCSIENVWNVVINYSKFDSVSIKLDYFLFEILMSSYSKWNYHWSLLKHNQTYFNLCLITFQIFQTFAIVQMSFCGHFAR